MARRTKKFDPNDPWPPYPPPEPLKRSIYDFEGNRLAREYAADAHGLYPHEVDLQDAAESGYLQAVQDIEDFLEEGE